MLGGLQLLSACFWLSVYGAAPEDTWEIGDSLRWITIVLLYVNAAISLAAVRRNSDGLALTLIFTFFLLLLLLAIEFGGSHPASCAAKETLIDPPTPLGTVMSKLLWTSDACVLMTILGWVTLAAGAVIGLYLQYMLLCFWVGVRASREDVRRVLRVIAALPMRRYTKPVKRAAAAAAASGSATTSTDNTACGGDCSSSSSATTPTPPPQHPEEEQRQRSIAAAAASEEEPESCSICLGEFEEGEEVRDTEMHACKPPYTLPSSAHTGTTPPLSPCPCGPCVHTHRCASSPACTSSVRNVSASGSRGKGWPPHARYASVC